MEIIQGQRNLLTSLKTTKIFLQPNSKKRMIESKVKYFFSNKLK